MIRFRIYRYCGQLDINLIIFGEYEDSKAAPGPQVLPSLKCLRVQEMFGTMREELQKDGRPESYQKDPHCTMFASFDWGHDDATIYVMVHGL